MMKAASINEIKKELLMRDADELKDLCMRLAKYKKENKELLTYLLFEANNEQSYIQNVKEDLVELFAMVPKNNTYLIKKVLRKVLRHLNRQTKYSGIPETELELRIFFCVKVKEEKLPVKESTVLMNLYRQQIKKIAALLEKLPEDLRADYQRDLAFIAQ
jgi:hypothetical protein